MRKHMGSRKSPGQSSRKSKSNKRKGKRFSPQVRKEAVLMHLEGQLSKGVICDEIGVCYKTLNNWIAAYEESGNAGLEDKPRKGRNSRLPEAVRDEIIATKKQDSSLGVKKIAQMLFRKLIPVSREAVRKTLHEEKLIDPPKKKRKKNDVKPRFFERASPNQMWQTDIMTFRLGGKNAYMIGYMDDYSRYLVGLEIFRSQTAEHVIELYRRSVGEYGVPKEMLTDNGRQYTNWRGTTRFEKELKKDRIKHIKSQPHHPMTLGKIERFWQTVLGEYLQRAQFDSFEQARERVRLWVKYYNHQRPHQGIGGLCPADRFFEVASDLRKVVERGIQDNTLELALRGEAKKPFYMVGRIDNQSVVMQAEKGKLVMRVNNEERQIDRAITPDNELIYDLNELKGEKNEQTISSEETQAQTQPEVYSGRESNGSLEPLERAPNDSRLESRNGLELHNASELAESGTGGYVENVRAASVGRRETSEVASEISETVSQEAREEVPTSASKQTEGSPGRAAEEVNTNQLLQQLLMALHQQSHMLKEGVVVADERGRSESADPGRSDHERAQGRDHSNGSSRTVGHVSQDLLPVAETSCGSTDGGGDGEAERPTEEASRSREGTAEERGSTVTGRTGNPQHAPQDPRDFRGRIRRGPYGNPLQ